MAADARTEVPLPRLLPDGALRHLAPEAPGRQRPCALAGEPMRLDTLRQAGRWVGRRLRWCGFWADFPKDASRVDGDARSPARDPGRRGRRPRGSSIEGCPSPTWTPGSLRRVRCRADAEAGRTMPAAEVVERLRGSSRDGQRVDRRGGRRGYGDLWEVASCMRDVPRSPKAAKDSVLSLEARVDDLRTLPEGRPLVRGYGLSQKGYR